MSPLMQIIFEQLYRTLSAALPESCRGLLGQYANTLTLRSRLEAEAMFQAASAARELL